jgi:hypothetical protein
MKQTTLLTLGSFLVISGCAGLLGDRKLDFKPLIEGKFSPRTQQTESSEESSHALLEKGYAKMGLIEREAVTERSFPEKKELKHQPVLPKGGHASDLLEESAGRGGEIATLIKYDKETHRDATPRGECLVDRTGKLVTQARFDHAHGFGEGLGYVGFREEKGWIAKRQPEQQVKATAETIHSNLRHAARQGDIKTMDYLLKEGADVNAKNQNGATALFAAALNGQTEAVKFLLSKGADINARDVHDYTVLIHVSASGNVEMVKLLVAQGADLKARNDLDLTALGSSDSANCDRMRGSDPTLGRSKYSFPRRNRRKPRTWISEWAYRTCALVNSVLPSVSLMRTSTSS